MSKKTLPAPDALTRALFACTHGATVSALPSLGVPLTRGVNDCPPSIENPRSTWLATEPPPIVHDTGIGHAAPNVSPPFGLVMKNGSPATVRTAVSYATPPPPVLLSRAVRRNVSFRSVEGSTSPF